MVKRSRRILGLSKVRGKYKLFLTDGAKSHTMVRQVQSWISRGNIPDRG
jgi:hypothetical protein